MQTYFLNDFKVNIPKYILPGTDNYLDPANVDFEVRLFVPPSAGVFVASHIGGKYVNCKVADSQICIIADGHQLAPGEVWYEAKYHLPDSDYPDGYCTLVEKSLLGLSLTMSADVEVREEQEASIAEQLREKNEAAREQAEANRNAAETARQTAEQSREQAEANRVAAESQRAETFAGWREAIEGSGSATSPTYSFDAQWMAAGGTVITPGKVYECNGGTGDLADAIKALSYNAGQIRANLSFMFFGQSLKMLPTVTVSCNAKVDMNQAFAAFGGCKKIVLKSNTNSKILCGDVLFAFNSSRVEEIDGQLDVSRATSLYTMFSNCRTLKEVRLYAIKENVVFKEAPHLSLASLQYLVDNAANTKAITVTVHPDVYAKLTGDTTNAAVAALPSDVLAQWQQVLADAMAKNISFATT